MLKSNKRNRFLIPMIGSIVLLIGFVAYFLNSEYEKEKDAIRLEQRDELFVSIISSIDTLFDENLLKQEGTKMRWAQDTTGMKVEYRVKYMDDSLSLHDVNDHFQPGNSPFNGQVKIIKGNKNLLPSFVTKSDTFISIVQHFDQAEAAPSHEQIIELSTSFEGDSSISNAINLINFQGGGPVPIPMALEKEIAPSSVLMRMIPQFSFSFILLFVVFISFYLIFRSLRQAHLLSALKNDFISNISHELKTPVSTISVALEALSNFDAGNDPKLRKEYIEISQMEAERLDMLVNKTLNINLYEQGKFVLDQQDISLDSEIDRILRSLKPSLEQKQIQLEYTKEGLDFSVFADRTHMTNVFYNLLENAIKYSPSPSKIEVELADRSNRVVLVVKDHGIGIEEQYVNKIFDKFFRVPQGDIHNVKGHGLGLSYVREVLHKHGGEIRVSSKFGEGSSFEVIIPRKNPIEIIE